MKNFITLAAAAVTLVLMSSFSLAANLDVAVSEKTIDTYNGDRGSVDVTITNRDAPQTFSISIFPNVWNRILVSTDTSLFFIGRDESKIVKVYFDAPLEATAGTNEFIITATSTQNPEINGNQTVRLRVFYKSPIFVTGVTTTQPSYNPEEKATIITTIRNDAVEQSPEFALVTTVMYEGTTVKVFDNFIDPLRGRSDHEVRNELELQRFTKPGNYVIESVLKDRLGFTINKKTGSFKVNNYEGVPTKDSKTSLGFLSASTTVSTRYTGNYPDSVTLTVVVPKFAKDLFVSESEFTSVEESGDTLIYKYTSPTLNPGEQYTIKYQYVIWQIWASGLIISGIVWLAFRFVFTPTLIKKYRKGSISKDKEILVTLEVKNRSMSDMKDIVIRDFAPGLGRVVSKFETVRPNLREARDGVELTWKFDHLHAQEERIVTYRIKPVMDIVGTLHLPSATMTYGTKKRLRRDATSREVVER